MTTKSTTGLMLATEALPACGLWAGHKDVTITPGATTTTNIVLLPPPEHFRRVTVTGNFHITDDEAIGNQTGDLAIADVIDMDLAHPTADRPYSKCVGGEVRLEVKLQLELQTNFSLSPLCLPSCSKAVAATATTAMTKPRRLPKTVNTPSPSPW